MAEMGVPYKRDGGEVLPAEDCIAWVEKHLDAAFAVGEIGLDGKWVPPELFERQEWVFRQLVALGMAADKPVIIHSRKRERRALEVLTEMGAQRVNWHCFSSKLKLAVEIASVGHFLSIPANVVHSQQFQRIVESIPRQQLLLETDCPYLGPERGTLNEPANVAGSLLTIASLWSCTPEVAQAQLEENFERLFGVAP
jgi:TatD DNase family protein